MDEDSVDRTITRPRATNPDFLGGFVAGEGCFTRGAPRAQFRFAVGLGAADRGMCDQLAGFLGVGRVALWARRKAHYDDEVIFSVVRTADLVQVVVPFMDAHLPPSHKRDQYFDWRADLFDYWDHTMRRRRTCTVEGCSRPQRARGVCRRHYYQRYGR